MKKINDMLYNLYKDGKYSEYIKLFLDYLNSGYSVSFEMIIYYLSVLVKLRKFDEVYNIVMNLKEHLKYDTKHELAKILYHCYKLDDALELLKSYNNHSFNDEYLLAKIYLLKGDLITSKLLFERMINNPCLSEKCKNSVKKHLQKIYNNHKFNAFVEIEYQSFLDKGNILTPGHVIYIKNSPLLINGHKEIEDSKSDSRPYLIWKIENNMIYMFPLSKNCGKFHYYLYAQNYPNSECDRAVKNNLSITTEDNILSVADKLNDNDYKIIISNLFVTSYSCKDNDEKEGRRKFLEDYVGMPKINDVISYYVPEEEKSYFYLVLDILEDDYQVIEINHLLTEFIGDTITIPKNRFIFSIQSLRDNILINQISILKRKITN